MAKQHYDIIGDLCRRYNLGAEEVCFGVLAGRGIDAGVAFQVIYRTSVKDPKTAARRLIDGKPQINVLIRAEREILRGIKPVEVNTTKSASGNIDLRSKSGVLDALEEAYYNADNPKMQADIIGKIADLQRMKNEEDKESAKTVHYYLPLRCDICPYKQASVKD